MNHYIVLYRDNGATISVPEGFKCQADDGDHAEEQCQNAYPNCTIVWVHEGYAYSMLDHALEDYYTTGSWLNEEDKA